ncbi:MAG: hypothetical protein Kow0059_00640 [Candidatus Sumerlaeia bacterium]
MSTILDALNKYKKEKEQREGRSTGIPGGQFLTHGGSGVAQPPGPGRGVPGPIPPAAARGLPAATLLTLAVILMVLILSAAGYLFLLINEQNKRLAEVTRTAGAEREQAPSSEAAPENSGLVPRPHSSVSGRVEDSSAQADVTQPPSSGVQAAPLQSDSGLPSPALLPVSAPHSPDEAADGGLTSAQTSTTAPTPEFTPLSISAAQPPAQSPEPAPTASPTPTPGPVQTFAAPPAVPGGREPDPRTAAVRKVEAGEIGFPRIDGIMWDLHDPAALVNGKILTVGDSIEGFKIIKINKDSLEVSKGVMIYKVVY